MKSICNLRYTTGWFLGVCGIAAVAVSVHVAPVFAQEFSSGYQSEASVSAGMAVSIVSEQNKTVEPTHRGNLSNVLGVVINGSDSLFAVTSQESDVQVATQGVTEMLVTDTNGAIQEGDYITASEVNGIGMRADDDHSIVIARAREDFGSVEARTIQTAGEESRTISVVRIPAVIQIGGNPNAKQTDSPLPGFLQSTANTLAGQPVSPARVIIALVVVAGGLVGSMVLLYGAVSNTIISIGRNPLSDKSIYAGLFRMVLIALVIILMSQALGYVIITV